MTRRYVGFTILLVIALCSAAIFASCGKEDNKIPFTPESGAYTLYFEPGWTILETDNSQQLFLSGPEELAFIITVDCFFKESLKDSGIESFDSYIDAFNSGEPALSIYGGHEADSVVSFKERSILNGKRQKVFIKSTEENNLPEDMTSEVIHLDTKYFYFALTYGNFNSKFEESQKIVSDAIKTLKVNYNGK